MHLPSFEVLENRIRDCGPDSQSYATFLHPNPSFYKYYWWVFWQGSPCDGLEFLSEQYRLSTKKAFEFRIQLKSEGKTYWLYNRQYPRLNPKNPFDVNSIKWKDAKWAPSFDDDTDEEYQGFK